MCTALAILLASRAPAQTQECLVAQQSVTNLGTVANSDSQAAWISSDGRYVAFESAASNLVQSDFNASFDIFVRDRFGGAIELVSRASTGAQADGECRAPSISDDGRYVAFESVATNLVDGDTNQKSDVFLRDRGTGKTSLISMSSAGVHGNGWSYRAAISADGRYVAFLSRSTNLAPGDANGASADVYVYDAGEQTCERVSVSTSGVGGNLPSERASISGDGRFVAFASAATNFVDGAPRAGPNRIYLRDRVTATTVLVSISIDGRFPNGACEMPAISRDGTAVAFQSAASDLVENDVNGETDVFVRDLVHASTEIASVASNRSLANGSSIQPSLSPDGMLVAFVSTATNLAGGGDTNGVEDVFVRDRVAGTTQRVSGTSSGQLGDARSTLRPGNRIASDAVIAFDSLATNLTATPASTHWDVFVRECVAEVYTPYCFGTDETCPCGNGSDNVAGCANSQSETGAMLGATGLPSVSSDKLTLSVQGAPAFAAVLFVQGDAMTNRGAGEPFADGLRCIGGALLRLGLRGAFEGAVSFGFGMTGDPHVSVMGGLTQMEVTRYYQAMYRDSAEFCSPQNVNFTNGIRVRWIP